MAEVEVRDAAVTVDVKIGDEVVVRLPENPTTGYVWSIESMDDGLLFIGDSSAAAAADRDAATPPGAGGTRAMRLRAVGPTGGQVVLQLCRSGEAEPLDERRITVTVRR